jgi:hypothetical protein
MIRATLLSIAIVVLHTWVYSLSAHAQSSLIEAAPIERAVAQAAIPRTVDGHPDFGGVWVSAFITDMGRLQGATKLVVSDEEAKKLGAAWIEMIHSPKLGHAIDPEAFLSTTDQLSQVNGEWRTSLITTAEGAQQFTEEGKRLVAQRREYGNALADGPEMRSPFERCLVGVGGAPLTPVPGPLLRQFIQTPDHLVLATESNDTRIIAIGAGPRPSAITSRLGDSTAYWEGDTLVVQTTGVKERVLTNLIIRPESRVIERFEMIGSSEVLYRFTVEDTAIYAQPWSAEYVFHRSNLPMYEYSCHEGNYGLVNILLAGRVLEARAKSKQVKAKAKRS